MTRAGVVSLEHTFERRKGMLLKAVNAVERFFGYFASSAYFCFAYFTMPKLKTSA